MSEPITDPSWIDQIIPPHGTVTGRFVAVSYDSADVDLSPDVQPFTGRVVLTATTSMGRLDDALAHIRPVTARIFGGQIVDDEDVPGVRILATDAEIGVEDWAWTAHIELDGGPKLKPITFMLPTGATVSITDGIVPIESAPFQLVEGPRGPTGPSAYDVAVADGFTGTVADWLASLTPTQATVDSALAGRVGSRTVAIDTDGTPFYTTSGATHYILTDEDGPYITVALVPPVGVDTDGTPYVS